MSSTRSETQSETNSQWFIRRGDVVRGPFSKEKIAQYLVRGSLKKGDQLSEDRENWVPATECTALFSPILIDENDDALLRQQLMAKKRWEMARDHLGEVSPYQQVERSLSESQSLRDTSSATTESSIVEMRREELGSRRTSRIVVGTVAFTLLSAIIALIFFNQPESDSGEVDCNAAAAPRVNWSNCQMEAARHPSVDLSGALMQNMNLMRAELPGALLVTANLSFSNLSAAVLTDADFREAKLVGVSLKGADLRNAKFDGADLSYADFQGAILRGASFTNVKLDKTIWVDGRVCAVGSVGQCQ